MLRSVRTDPHEARASDSRPPACATRPRLAALSSRSPSTQPRSAREHSARVRGAGRYFGDWPFFGMALSASHFATFAGSDLSSSGVPSLGGEMKSST